MIPCLVREDFRTAEVNGQVYTYCSPLCRWTHQEAFAREWQGIPTPNMGRFSGRRQWEECYHGWDWADIVRDLEFVRSDGKTLVAQPNLNFDEKGMWTVDMLRGYHYESPLVNFRRMTPEQRTQHEEEYRKGFTIS
jgi:propane monooxygenase large subunit